MPWPFRDVFEIFVRKKDFSRRESFFSRKKSFLVDSDIQTQWKSLFSRLDLTETIFLSFSCCDFGLRVPGHLGTRREWNRFTLLVIVRGGGLCPAEKIWPRGERFRTSSMISPSIQLIWSHLFVSAQNSFDSRRSVSRSAARAFLVKSWLSGDVTEWRNGGIDVEEFLNCPRRSAVIRDPIRRPSRPSGELLWCRGRVREFTSTGMQRITAHFYSAIIVLSLVLFLKRLSLVGALFKETFSAFRAGRLWKNSRVYARQVFIPHVSSPFTISQSLLKCLGCLYYENQKCHVLHLQNEEHREISALGNTVKYPYPYPYPLPPTLVPHAQPHQWPYILLLTVKKFYCF